MTIDTTGNKSDVACLWGVAWNADGAPDHNDAASHFASLANGVTGAHGGFWRLAQAGGQANKGAIWSSKERGITVGVLGMAWALDDHDGEATSLLADLYEQHGAQLINHCDGQFTAAIIDKSERRVMLIANWPGGLHLLYYCVREKTLYFATRLHILMKLCGNRPRVNEHALVALLHFGGIFSEDTLFAGARRVLPGTAVVYQRGRVTVMPAWQCPVGENRDPVDAEEFFAVYEAAIRRRLSGSQEVGAFLSGGLDSSMNVAVMAQHNPHRVKTFPISFGTADFDESPWARLVATTFNTEHHELRLDSPTCLDRLPEMVWGMEEPIADESYIPTFFLGEYIRRYVAVAMAGDGPDHLLGRDYGRAAWHRLLRCLPGAGPLALWSSADNAAAAPMRNAIWSVLRRARVGRQAWQALTAAHPTAQRAVLSGLRAPLWGVLPPSAMASLVSKDLARRIGGDLGQSIELAPLPWPARNAFDAMTLADSWVSGVCGVFTKVGKMCGVHDLAVREPFLATTVVRYLLQLARHWKVRGHFVRALLRKIPHTATKIILRSAAEKRLPHEILTKSKHGFDPPLAEWFRRSIAGLRAEQVFEALVRDTDWFNVHFLDRLLAEHAAGRHNHHYLLLLLAALDQWHRIYLRDEPRRPSWSWSDCFRPGYKTACRRRT